MCCCKEVDVVNSDFVTKFDCILISYVCKYTKIKTGDFRKVAVPETIVYFSGNSSIGVKGTKVDSDYNHTLSFNLLLQSND